MVGKNLSKLLQERGISARELAKRAKINESSISLYISGKRDPSLRILARIAKALNVTLDRLVLGRVDQLDLEFDLERVLKKYQDLLIRDKSPAYNLETDLKARLEKSRGAEYQQELFRLNQLLGPEVIEDLYFFDKPRPFQMICEKLKENPALSTSIISQLL